MTGKNYSGRWVDLEPLDWDEKEQCWSWPPKSKTKLFGATVRHWEDILRFLAVQPGHELTDQSGRAMSKLQAGLGYDPPMSNTAFNTLFLGLVQLGLVERTKPSEKAKRTTRVALAVPVEQLPKKLRPIEWLTRIEPSGAITPIPDVTPEEGDAFLAAATSRDETVSPAAQDGAIDPQAVAMFLLDEVVKRANANGGNTTALEEELSLANQRIEKLVALRKTLKEQYDKGQERIRDLTQALSESEARRKQLNRNLEAALAACRDLAERAGTKAREETVKGLERLMQRSIER